MQFRQRTLYLPLDDVGALVEAIPYSAQADHRRVDCGASDTLFQCFGGSKVKLLTTIVLRLQYQPIYEGLRTFG